jgi:hypothetical protein
VLQPSLVFFYRRQCYGVGGVAPCTVELTSCGNADGHRRGAAVEAAVVPAWGLGGFLRASVRWLAGVEPRGDGWRPPAMIGSAVAWSPFPNDDVIRFLSLCWRSSTSICCCSDGPCGDEQQAREKSLLLADDGDAHGCRLLLEGVVMASTTNPLPQA